MIGHLVGWTVVCTDCRAPPSSSIEGATARSGRPSACSALQPLLGTVAAHVPGGPAKREGECALALPAQVKRLGDGLARLPRRVSGSSPPLSPPPLSSLPPAHPPRALRYFLLFSRRPRTPRAVRLGGQACALQPRARATLGARGAPRRPRRAATRRRRPRRAPPRRPPG